MAARQENFPEGYDVSRFVGEVKEDLFCSICQKVPKDARLCKNKDHVFCLVHISQHLQQNSKTCPVCRNPLTLETLRQPTGFLKNYLDNLKIKCDHHHRKCPEVIRLQDLPKHVGQCDFAPIICGNEGCGMVVNKKDKDYHEQICNFGIAKCQGCQALEASQDEMKFRLEKIKENQDKMKPYDDEEIKRTQKLTKLELKDIRDKITGMERNLEEKRKNDDEIKKTHELMKMKLTEKKDDRIEKKREETKKDNNEAEKAHALLEMELNKMKDKMTGIEKTQDETKKNGDEVEKAHAQLKIELNKMKDKMTGIEKKQEETKKHSEEVTCSKEQMNVELIEIKNKITGSARKQEQIKDEMKVELSEMKDKITGIEKKQEQTEEEMKAEFNKMKDKTTGIEKKQERTKDEMKVELNKMKDKMTGIGKKQEQTKDEMKEELKKMKDKMTAMERKQDRMQQSVDEIKQQSERMMIMFNKVLEESNVHNNSAQATDPQVPANNQDIIILGGRYGSTADKASSTVEKFNIAEKKSTELPRLNKPREESASCVYNGDVIVTGGHDGRDGIDSIEILKMTQHPLRWTMFAGRLPVQLSGHVAIIYQNKLYVIGGYNWNEKKTSDIIYELDLVPPYAAKLLARMPQVKTNHRAEIFAGKIFILGGTTTGYSKDAIDSVVVYDFIMDEFTFCLSLPKAVCRMSTVSQGNKIIIVGGEDKNGQVLHDVIIYDCETGGTDKLPSLKQKRSGCSAVMTDDFIVVLGGGKKQKQLNSVESFTMGSDGWKELPGMKEKRRSATAVVLPRI